MKMTMTRDDDDDIPFTDFVEKISRLESDELKYELACKHLQERKIPYCDGSYHALISALPSHRQFEFVTEFTPRFIMSEFENLKNLVHLLPKDQNSYLIFAEYIKKRRFNDFSLYAKMINYAPLNVTELLYDTIIEKLKLSLKGKPDAFVLDIATNFNSCVNLLANITDDDKKTILVNKILLNYQKYFNLMEARSITLNFLKFITPDTHINVEHYEDILIDVIQNNAEIFFGTWNAEHKQDLFDIFDKLNQDSWTTVKNACASIPKSTFRDTYDNFINEYVQNRTDKEQAIKQKAEFLLLCDKRNHLLFKPLLLKVVEEIEKYPVVNILREAPKLMK